MERITAKVWYSLLPMVIVTHVSPPKAHRGRCSVLLFSWPSGSLFYHQTLFRNTPPCFGAMNSRPRCQLPRSSTCGIHCTPPSLDMLLGNCHLLPTITSAARVSCLRLMQERIMGGDERSTRIQSPLSLACGRSI